MSQIDAETCEWLSTLKLGSTVTNTADLQSGYYLGLIFDRLNLARGRKFKNTKDMAIRFQNFKNIRDLLYENFKVEFPIQNILYNTQQLLITIRDCCKEYNNNKREATFKRIAASSASKIQPQQEKLFETRQKDILMGSKMAQTGKLPKKIQDIEGKLEKYRQIKTKHEIMALQQRRKELDDNRRMIEEHRLFEINKTRINHQFTKEHERRVQDICMKTQQVKLARIEKDNKLKSFLQEKKQKFQQSLRDDEVRFVKQGLEAFELNCIRQGIELQHDPDRVRPQTEDKFNSQVVMERIKDNIKQHEIDKKQRIKRENKKNVDGKIANLKAEAIWNENQLVQDYAQKINSHHQKCIQIQKTLNREKAQRQIIIEKRKNRVFQELPPPKTDPNERQQQFAKANIQYLQAEVVRLEKKQKQQRAIAEVVLQALLGVTIQYENDYKNKGGFNFRQWQHLQQAFVQYKAIQVKSKDKSVFIDQSYQDKAKDYVRGTGLWQPEAPLQDKKVQLSNLTKRIIETAYPMNEKPQKSDIPLYMPLKIICIGNKGSGKTALSQKLAEKYQILLINPKNVISQAIQLNKEPVVEDPKKKKDPKKVQQESPEKIALKQWGQKLLKTISSAQEATILQFIQAIQFKLRQNFQNKAGSQILRQFEDSKVAQQQRHAKALKDFQQQQKKGKKDSKKPASEEDPPVERKYFYTKGFIVDLSSFTVDDAKQIQRALNSFISFQQRVNVEGESLKERIQSVVQVPKIIKSLALQKGAFDLMIQLEVSQDILRSRQPQSNDLSNVDYSQLQNYYQVFGDERSKSLAYQKVRNENSLQQCLDAISKLVETHLDSQYQRIRAQLQLERESRLKQSEHEQSHAGHTNKHIDQEQKKPINDDAVSGQVQKQAVSKTLLNQLQQENEIRQDAQSSLLTISAESCVRLGSKLDQIYSQYISKVSGVFAVFDRNRDDFDKALKATQQTFVNIIIRPDDKAGKILNFQQNYNKLLSEKTSIVRDAQASRHLVSKLDQVYDGLWASLQGKKNQAISQRTKTIGSDFLNSHIQKLIETAKKLMQNELNLITNLIFFVYNVVKAAEGSKEEIHTEYLVLGIPPSKQPIKSFNLSTLGSERLEYYASQTFACLDQLPQWLKKQEKKFKLIKNSYFEGLLAELIERRRAILTQRVRLICQKAKEYYLEYHCYFTILTNKMDDWIIQGIKSQNQFVYDIYKNIKKNILEAKKSTVKDLIVRDITEHLKPLAGLLASRLPILGQTHTSKYKILSFVVFMEQIRCLASFGRIPFGLFRTYMEKRKKSKLLDEEYLKLELDIVQQFLVTDDYLSFRQIAFAVLMWNTRTMQEESINTYEQMLRANEPDITGSNFERQQLSLGQFRLMDGVAKDRTEQRILKSLVFEIFREEYKDTLNIKEYVETLRLFNQLQIYRYGDAVMILRQSPHKSEKA